MARDIRAVLPVLSAGTLAIESAFLSAGKGLSHGLDVFRSLSDDLVALGAELSAGSAAKSSSSLSHMTIRLKEVGDRLPADGKVLADLLATNKGLIRRFDDLIGDMRMMVVVSRSARLEAVASAEQRTSLEAFSRTIDEQIGAVQRRIDHCAADHAALTALLERAAWEHFAFDTSFRPRLVALAGQLDAAASWTGQRRSAGLAVMEDAAARARAITRAAGAALVSLQIGDNTRQRLEHVSYGLERAEALAAGGRGAEPDAATAGLLYRVEQAQLQDTVSSFETEAARVLDAFVALGRETAALVTRGRAVCGQDHESPAASMSELKTGLTDALDIVAACDAARSGVSRAIDALRAMLDALDDTLATLMTTSHDLTVVAMNVGLKAGRLGTRGRGLVTVAVELKRLSGRIAGHADGLLTAFKAVRRDADHFGPTGRTADAGPESLADEALAILAEITEGDDRITKVLERVERAAQDFDAAVTGAADAFGTVVADTMELLVAADTIGAAADATPPRPDGASTAALLVDGMKLPLYSMSQERDVHAAVVDPFHEGADKAFEERAA